MRKYSSVHLLQINSLTPHAIVGKIRLLSILTFPSRFLNEPFVSVDLWSLSWSIDWQKSHSVPEVGVVCGMGKVWSVERVKVWLVCR